MARMFEADAKNYHVWSYRQWLVRRFGLWDVGELAVVDGLLQADVRNNSAWNHRWFIVFGRPAGADADTVQREIQCVVSLARLCRPTWLTLSVT